MLVVSFSSSHSSLSLSKVSKLIVLHACFRVSLICFSENCSLGITQRILYLRRWWWHRCAMGQSDEDYSSHCSSIVSNVRYFIFTSFSVSLSKCYILFSIIKNFLLLKNDENLDSFVCSPFKFDSAAIRWGFCCVPNPTCFTTKKLCIHYTGAIEQQGQRDFWKDRFP